MNTMAKMYIYIYIPQSDLHWIIQYICINMCSPWDRTHDPALTAELQESYIISVISSKAFPKENEINKRYSFSSKWFINNETEREGERYWKVEKKSVVTTEWSYADQLSRFDGVQVQLLVNGCIDWSQCCSNELLFLKEAMGWIEWPIHTSKLRPDVLFTAAQTASFESRPH